MAYNGWSNRYTWTVNLWLSNDEGLSARAAKLAAEAASDGELADQFIELIQEEVFGENEPGSLASDLLGTVLDEVDWIELARAWMRD